MSNHQDGNRPLPFDREQLGKFAYEAFTRHIAKTHTTDWEPVSWENTHEVLRENYRVMAEAVARWTLIGDAARAAFREMME